MTSVLLISDTDKVQRLFASLEKKGLFQLRVAATLTQGDQEIAGSAPDVTFVQSRISGFSGLIMLRHLKKALPKQAKLVLLAGDADDAEQARQGAVPFLDLTVEDEALAGEIRELIEGAGRPAARKKPAAAQQVDIGKITPQAKKGAPAPLAAARGAAAAEKAKKEKPVVPEAPQARPVPEPKEPVKAAAKKTAKEPMKELGKEPAKRATQALKDAKQAVREPARAVTGPEPTKKPVLEPAKGPLKEPEKEPLKEQLKVEAPVKEPLAAEKSAAPAVRAKEEAATAKSPVAEAKEQAGHQKAPEVPTPEPEEPELKERPVPAAAKGGAPSFEEVMRRAAAKTGAAPSAPSQVEDRVHFGKPAHQPVAAPELQVSPDREKASEAGPEKVYQGEPLEEAMLRAQKKKLPGWLIPLAVALVFIPLAVFYLVGRKPTVPPPPGQTAPTMAPGPTTAQGPASSPLSAAKPPEGKTEAGPEAEPSARPGPEPAAQPARKTGLKTLPPIVQGLRLDPEYGKTEPGWIRYIGATAEYKLFREADLYRAMQVIALAGATIPDQIFKRVLLEFGGSESYRVESTGKKGDYLLEHGSVNGQVGLTIYRRKDDLQMKGFVVYYR